MTLRLLFADIRSNVKKICDNLGYPQTEFDVSEASRPEFGDVSCNVGFLLAKSLKKRPFEIAESIANEYKDKGKFVTEVSAHNSGYLNFVANYPLLTQSVIQSSIQENYG